MCIEHLSVRAGDLCSCCAVSAHVCMQARRARSGELRNYGLLAADGRALLQRGQRQNPQAEGPAGTIAYMSVLDMVTVPEQDAQSRPIHVEERLRSKAGFRSQAHHDKNYGFTSLAETLSIQQASANFGCVWNATHWPDRILCTSLHDCLSVVHVTMRASAVFLVDKPQIVHLWTRRGGILAFTATGKPLLLFAGIIDILQQYRLVKKMEHFVKGTVYDGVCA